MPSQDDDMDAPETKLRKFNSEQRQGSCSRFGHQAISRHARSLRRAFCQAPGVCYPIRWDRGETLVREIASKKRFFIFYIFFMDREAAYLIKYYVDPRDDDVEYDPPPPWCPSGAVDALAGENPHVVVELGAGLGVVGLSIAETLQKYRECGGRASPREREQKQEQEQEQEGVQFSKSSPLPDVVVLIDLEDVCDQLLDPQSRACRLRVAGSAHTSVQRAILPCEWQGGSPPSQCGGVSPEHGQERTMSASVQVVVRPLAWGLIHYVESLAGALMPYQTTNATLTIVCSDLVRTYFSNRKLPVLIFWFYHGMSSHCKRCISRTSWRLSYAFSFT